LERGNEKGPVGRNWLVNGKTDKEEHEIGGRRILGTGKGGGKQPEEEEQHPCQQLLKNSEGKKGGTHK